jgi:hypothetical protein
VDASARANTPPAHDYVPDSRGFSAVADQRHKRETEARRKPKALAVIGPLAVLATASAVTLGVVLADPATSNLAPLGAAPTSISSPRNEPPITRNLDRVQLAAPAPVVDPNFMSKAAIKKAVSKASERLWATDDLNIWTQPGDKAKKIGEIEAGKKVLVTGRELWGRTEIVVKNESRWVTEGYLSDEKPPTLGGSCTNGTSVASGVSSNVVAVHEAVCANFPDISVYGTLRGGGGDHGSGHAVDIMISGEAGWAVANFVRENASALGVSYVIYSQSIWSVERSGEGWRGMSNRGSDTANHYDHVHVSVF